MPAQLVTRGQRMVKGDCIQLVNESTYRLSPVLSKGLRVLCSKDPEYLRSILMLNNDYRGT